MVDFDFVAAGFAIAVLDPPAPSDERVSCVDVAIALP